MGNNVVLNKTFDQYNKKYKNRNYRLLKYTKKEVEDFDRRSNTKIKNFLLEGRRWWCINNIYYEIPKPIRFTWFRNLNVGIQAGICLLGAGAIATAITLPVIAINNQQSSEPEIFISEGEFSFDKEKSHIELNKDSYIVLKTEGKKEIAEIKSVKVADKEIEKEKDWTYDSSLKRIDIKAHAMTSTKISIELSTEVPVEAKDFKTCEWSYIAEKCNQFEEGKISSSQFAKSFIFDSVQGSSLDDFIGKERTIKVNNQNHTVRVIGVNQDKDTNDKQLALTFEFGDILSGTDGYSLSYQWFDTNANVHINEHFEKSSIRKILSGVGDFSTSIYVGSMTTSKTPKGRDWDPNYKDKTILSMLPDELTKEIKTTKKTVRTGSDYSTITDCSDKLFLLSAKELGIDEESHDEEFTYTYYNDAETSQQRRIKKQVKGTDGAISKKVGVSPSTKQTVYKNIIYCYAGYNYTVENCGSIYWTRTASSANNRVAIVVNYDGKTTPGYPDNISCPIAPAFCI